MESIGTALRRTFILVVLAAAIGAVLSSRRGVAATPTPAAAPLWPPLPTHEPEPAPGQGWLAPNDDATTPAGHPIKVKESSGIFHLPGGRFYDRTKPDRCYPTAADAEADGYRQSKA